MTQVKNIKPISALEKDYPHRTLHNSLSNVKHLQIFGSTVYIFIYKEEQKLKLEKFKTQALKDILVRYNRHTIYKIFIQKQNKVI